MDAELIQTGIAGLVVAGAALYAGTRVRRTIAAARAPKDAPGCGGGCGCGTDAH